MRIRIGTRASKLALWQTNWVADLLRAEHPGIEIEVVEIRTSGDKIQDRPLHLVGGKGLFIKELERALLDSDVDIAVHSMKDVPATVAPGLDIVAMPERASEFDALVSDNYASVADLPEGARVGTGAFRRQFQLLRTRSDLQVVGIRGNVGTRLRKLRDADENLDAIVLAVAGLERLGMGDEIAERLRPDGGFLPAIGQGAVGIEARSDDVDTIAALRAIAHPLTEHRVRAERGVLKALEGDCTLPIAAYTQVQGDRMSIVARLGMPDASEILEGEVDGDLTDDEALGRALGSELLSRGGRELMARLQHA